MAALQLVALLSLIQAVSSSHLVPNPRQHALRDRSVVHKPVLKLRGGSGGLDWRYFVAGSISAGLSHGYTTPIDVVKTRMQTNPELYNSTLDAVRKIVKDDGPLFLLQGLGPTVLGYGAEGAIKFGSYEMCKPLFASLTPSKMLNYLFASCVAGALAAVVLCPAEEIRIKLVADPSYAPSAGAALLRLSREKGILASLLGFPAMAAKQVPYTMGKQVSFDFLCTLAALLIKWSVGSGCSDALVKKLAPTMAALPAAVLAAVMSHPGDCLLTEYYKGTSPGLLYSLRRMIREHGLGGLFIGLQARLVHVIGIIWVQLIMYDSIKVALGLPSTGH